MTTLAFIAAAFVIGFLLGDRRGVKQCNNTLDHNMRVLLEAVGDDPRAVRDQDETDDRRPTVH